MRLFQKTDISFLLLFMLGGLCLYPAVSQTVPVTVNEMKDELVQSSVEDGIYENKKHFYIVQDGEPVSTVLKSFYGFWYDGIYDMEPSILTCPLVQMDDNLYLEWWQNIALEENEETGGVFWAPGSNIRELAISPYPVKEKLSGWFILKADESSDRSGAELVYEIPYWQADVAYADDVASFELSEGKTAYVKKFIQLGDTVYTCATGRRKTVRNPAVKTSLPGTPAYSDDGLIMVLDEPYLVKADISDMQTEIDAHNALRYPPHFAYVDMTEPEVYRKLDEMSVEMIINTLKF